MVPAADQGVLVLAANAYDLATPPPPATEASSAVVGAHPVPSPVAGVPPILPAQAADVTPVLSAEAPSAAAQRDAGL